MFSTERKNDSQKDRNSIINKIVNVIYKTMKCFDKKKEDTEPDLDEV